MKARYIYTAAFVVAVIDQITKLAVQSRLPYGASVPLAGPVDITLVRNPGGAFGLFQSGTVPITIISLIVVLGIVWVSRRSGTVSPMIGAALALQLGGAVGNLADRLRLGYVVDFINVQVWPVFNIADVAITGGIVLLAVFLLLCERAAPATARDPQTVESEAAKR